MSKTNSTFFSALSFFIIFFGGVANAQSNDLKFLSSLERCQQKQYSALLKSHEKVSDLADTSDDKAEFSKKSSAKLHSAQKFKKSKIALSKEIRYRKRQGALLGVDSNILALISEVLSNKTRVNKYKTRLKKNRGYINQAVLGEIASANEQVDQNYHEITMKSFILKMKIDRNFQSCVVGQPEIQASL